MSSGPQAIPGAPLDVQTVTRGLESARPDERLKALEALILRRGDDAGRLAGRAMADPDDRVAQRAREVRDQIAEDTRLFGGGALLRVDLPAPLRSPAQEKQLERRLWTLWSVGGVLIVTLLGVQRHSSALALPLVAVFFLMLALFALTARLRRDLPSPGWLFLDPVAQEVILERYDDRGSLRRSSWTFSHVVGLGIRGEQQAATPEDESAESGGAATRLEQAGRELVASGLLVVVLDGGTEVPLFRRDSIQELRRVAERLEAWTGLRVRS